MVDLEKAKLIAKALVVAEADLQRRFQIGTPLSESETEKIRYEVFLETIKLMMLP